MLAVAVGVTGALAGLILGEDEARWAGLVLAPALAWASMVDIDRFILPDALTLGLVLAGLGLAAPLGWDAVLDRSIGAVAGYASLSLVAAVYARLRRRDGLGLGDAKLFAAAGAWLGWASLPFVMLIASASGIAWAAISLLTKRPPGVDGRLPFGPFIAAGFWAVWLASAT
jgi:leader peptidase (prepilin peptidase) / N-methyltransferase